MHHSTAGEQPVFSDFTIDPASWKLPKDIDDQTYRLAGDATTSFVSPEAGFFPTRIKIQSLGNIHRGSKNIRLINLVYENPHSKSLDLQAIIEPLRRFVTQPGQELLIDPIKPKRPLVLCHDFKLQEVRIRPFNTWTEHTERSGSNLKTYRTYSTDPTKFIMILKLEQPDESSNCYFG